MPALPMSRHFLSRAFSSSTARARTFSPIRLVSESATERINLSATDHPLLDLSKLPVEVRQQCGLQDDDFVLYPSFASMQEQNDLSTACMAMMDRILATPRAMAKKRKLGAALTRDNSGFLPPEAYVFEQSHFDGVIDNYRECSISDASFPDAVADLLRRLYALFDAKDAEQVSAGIPAHLMVHLLHLGPDGAIYPHVDNVEASAGTIAGLSLGSARVMRMRLKDDPEHGFEALLPPGSAYVQKGAIRYKFEHEIPKLARFRGQEADVGGQQRLSVMVRVRSVSQADQQVWQERTGSALFANSCVK